MINFLKEKYSQLETVWMDELYKEQREYEKAHILNPKTDEGWLL